VKKIVGIENDKIIKNAYICELNKKLKTMAIETEKKQLISHKTLKKVKQVEDKISKALQKFSSEFDCSLNNLYIRIIGCDDDYPAYAVYKDNVKLADVEIGDVIGLSTIEQFVVNEDEIQETIYRSLEKILIGFDDETKLSNLYVVVYKKSDVARPQFYLYKNNKPHKPIKSHQII
jgi:hypothetical protein